MLDKRRNAPAPDFAATDSTGNKIKLADYAGKKHIVLVFNRGFG
jgi:peroxiredoxin